MLLLAVLNTDAKMVHTALSWGANVNHRNTVSTFAMRMKPFVLASLFVCV
jgi:hypothetical protein